MAAFTELDWHRFDVWAIVGSNGIATIEEGRRAGCLEWLRQHRYAIASLDCRRGLAQLIADVGQLFDWEKQFGYVLELANCNLNALRDGFAFEIPEDGGRVLEFVRPDVIWSDDSQWLIGILAIALEHSRRQLALGRRFFALLVIGKESPLLGATIENTAVPVPFWSPCRDIHEFRT